MSLEQLLTRFAVAATPNQKRDLRGEILLRIAQLDARAREASAAGRLDEAAELELAADRASEKVS